MQLGEPIERARQYLSDRICEEPKYDELIAEIAESALQNQKLKVTIVSPDLNLAEKIYRLSISDEILSSSHNFQQVSPIKHLDRIINNCDIICSVYDFNKRISKFEKCLIEKSIFANISNIIFVVDNRNSTKNLAGWLESQKYPQLENCVLPLNCCFDSNNNTHINIYRQSIKELSCDRTPKQKDRTIEQTTDRIKKYFASELKSLWQEIEKEKNVLENGQTIDEYRQQVNRCFPEINRYHQQFFRKVKQYIHHAKANLTNPFATDSLMYSTQQLIKESQIKQIKEDKTIELYLTLDKKEKTKYIHFYIIEICQQAISDFIDSEWNKINFIYENGGIKQLSILINDKLATVAELSNAQGVFDLPKKPQLDIANFVSLQALKKNSSISFDYHFTQSSWFRLFVSALIGLAIYLFTKTFSDNGRFFGFVILIYQFINLFTKQDVKTNKLKQHSKELKRIVDTRYQNLVRFCLEKASQETIAALDNTQQEYQQQLDNMCSSINQQIAEIKQRINKHKIRIERLKKDREELMKLLSSE